MFKEQQAYRVAANVLGQPMANGRGSLPAEVLGFSSGCAIRGCAQSADHFIPHAICCGPNPYPDGELREASLGLPQAPVVGATELLETDQWSQVRKAAVDGYSVVFFANRELPCNFSSPQCRAPEQRKWSRCAAWAAQQADEGSRADSSL